mmetsp:Transcript_5026/g.12823  ORF Transcript_5026/g.12823 Transcript_5026/m.12823 type:complete len:722 (-) Transcript_5026:224-2389(-)
MKKKCYYYYSLAWSPSFLFHLFLAVNEFLYDGRVGEGGGVAELVELVRRDLPQDSPHDLPAPRLREARREVDGVRRRERADVLPADHDELLSELLTLLRAVHQCHERVDALPLDRVLVAHHGRLAAQVVRVQRALHLRRADPVPTHVNHIIHAARDPVVPVGIAPAPVAGEVVAVVVLEVHCLEPLLISVDGPHLGRPGLLDGEVALAGALELVALLIQHHRLDAEERVGGRPWLHAPGTRQRGDHDAPGLRLPPRVDDRAVLVAHELVVPEPGLRVDGLAHTSEQPQRGPLVLLHPLVTETHQGPDGGRRSVELGHLVLVDDLPAPAGVRVGRHALEDQGGHAVQERAVGEVGVSGDPAAVCRAPVDVAGLGVEDVLDSGVGADHVAGGGVQHALGLARGSARVEHEEGVLRLHPLHGTLLVLLQDGLVPPLVPRGLERGRVARQRVLVLEHEAGLDVVALLLAEVERVVHNLLQRDELLASEDPGGGDEDGALAVEDPVAEGGGTEAGEDDGVDGADARAGQHGGRQLGQHRHVDVHAVALLHPDGLEVVRNLADLVLELLVREGRAVGGLVPLPDDGGLVAAPLLDVPVEGVVGQVRGAAGEPAHADGALGVAVVVGEHVLRQVDRLLEVEPAVLDDVGPEALGISEGPVVHGLVLVVRVHARVGDEGGRGRDGSALRRGPLRVAPVALLRGLIVLPLPVVALHLSRVRRLAAVTALR